MHGLFDGSTIDLESTVDESYHSTKVKMLRLYMHTSAVDSEDASKLTEKLNGSVSRDDHIHRQILNNKNTGTC